jgi:dTDP-4-amino-4,6-dideoxygalactose transaminase
MSNLKTEMHVPLIDLSRAYQSVREEILKEITRVCDSQHFILGSLIQEFEEQAARYQQVPYAVGVASGTDALILSLATLGVGAGSEVITTAMSFIATAGPVHLLGAKPVFVDIDPATYNINPQFIEAKITPKTKAIIVVHLYGQMCNMGEIQKIASKHNIPVIEDCAQAMGARDNQSRIAGSVGDLGCFSFFPTKNLGAFGDGGLITTHRQEWAEKLKAMRTHGSKKRYYSDFVGYNSRLDALQAAVLKIKLKYLDSHLSARKQIAKLYNELFQKNNLTQIVKIPFVQKNYEHTYHLYTILVPKKEKLMAYLAEQGVDTNAYYPVPLPFQKCFSYLNYKTGDFPHAEHIATQALSLPCFPGLTPSEQEYVATQIKRFYAAS